ncbi:hypothetical protein [Halobaculum sp. D14]|uniref:hypothetical protein n=1 Tax=Halobaculum sp. D14 TaxID=3421642 RepID=UPI003EB946A1
MPPSATLTDADRRVLAYLAADGPDYPALVAGNTGLHVPLVERRIESLTALGYLEAVSGESIYRTTAAGRDALDGERTVASTDEGGGADAAAVADGGNVDGSVDDAVDDADGGDAARPEESA